MRVLFVDNSVRDFEPRDRIAVHKFLGWNNLLIVGGHDNHQELYDAYCKLTGENPGEPTMAGDLSPVPQYDRLYVTKWSSFHFNIGTPMEMEPVVLEALGAKQMDDYS